MCVFFLLSFIQPPTQTWIHKRTIITTPHVLLYKHWRCQHTHTHAKAISNTCTMNSLIQSNVDKKNFNGIHDHCCLLRSNGFVWKRYVSHPITHTHIVFTFAQNFSFQLLTIVWTICLCLSFFRTQYSLNWILNCFYFSSKFFLSHFLFLQIKCEEI